MLPIEGIEQQAVNPLYMPGNTLYVISVERIIWRGSHTRDCVFGGSSVPRLVFLPIVDFPLMGKNYNPVANYQQAAAEVSMSTQIANASRVDGGLPMTRKLAIHCVQELVENYRQIGLTDVPLLTNLTREQVGQVYMSVLPPYVTKPGLEGVKRAIGKRADGKPIFTVNEVTMLDSSEKESEFDLTQLQQDVTRRNHFPGLPRELHEIAAKTQESIEIAVETAISYRRDLIDRETAEIAASKTNNGKGITAYSHLAKRYAVSLNLELIDPVIVQRKEFVKEAAAASAPAPTMPVAVENPSNDRLAEAINGFTAAVQSLQLQVQQPSAQPVAKSKQKKSDNE